MRRGDVVVAADDAGDYAGKPRAFIVVQSDLFNPTHPSVTTVPLTSELRNDAPAFRITIEPDAANGLRLVSQAMVDKITTVRRARIGRVVGHLDPEALTKVSRAAALWLGIV
jgi:mRNA interferase MazF